MTEKNIFGFWTFLSLKISDSNWFKCKNCNPPEKGHAHLFPTTPSKNWGPVKPFLFENLVGGSFPLAETGGVHYTAASDVYHML